MRAQKILVPTDFSHSGDAAMRTATVLAKDTGAKLLIVHVEELPQVYTGGEFYYGVPEPAQEDLERMLADIKPTDPEVEYEHRMVTGTPASAIVKLADDEQVDMIVMGTHGRTGLARMLMGSVAESIVRKAKCPVLTYKPSAKEIDLVGQ